MVQPQIQQLFDLSGSSGGRGTAYEARMCILCFLRGYTRNHTNFSLVYQAPEQMVVKFDDVVFDEGGEKYQLIQLKHKESQDDLKITHSELFKEKFNSDYSLLMYLRALHDVMSHSDFKDKIKKAVVFTNIDFAQNKDKKHNLYLKTKNQRPKQTKWYDGLESLDLKPVSLGDSVIFDVSASFPNAKYYAFDEKVVPILKRQSETFALEMAAKAKTQTGKLVGRAAQQQIEDDKLLKFLQNVTEKDIHDALQLLIYAVAQPNDTALETLIRTEIKDHFKLQSSDAIYNALENWFRNWCDTKGPLDPTTTSTNPLNTKQHVISYKDADELFQNHVKTVSFGVIAPSRSFTGRVNELLNIRTRLNEKPDLLVSQTRTVNIAISGLGGIGKTELTKQFIKDYGKTDFYGRVIWIEADSNKSVKKSFELLAEKLKVENVQSKTIKGLIDEVFGYFDGFKVLFVFDNFDTIPESNDESLVVYCRKSASDPNKRFRPYFLFTSRDRKCLPNVPSLDLSVLSADDALKFISNELKEVTNILGKSELDTDAATLANTLQYFPLALQQAISYIREQADIILTGYGITEYLIKFFAEREELLSHRFPNDFGEYEKTTFITWNVTLKAIQSDTIDGQNAIKVLKYLAYLYADNIDPSMFLSLFENDSDCVERAFNLLERYSMITKVQVNNKIESVYQVHRLVQTVIQIKFRENEEDIVEQDMKLVDPELYSHYNKGKPELYVKFLEKLTANQLLHYNNLSSHIQKYDKLKRNFRGLFYNLKDSVLVSAAYLDDVEKVKALNVSQEDLKKFIEINIEQLMQRQCNKVIKYFVQTGVLHVNEEINVILGVCESLIRIAISASNFKIFKFLIENGADFTNVLKFASIDLILNIVEGKLDKVQTVIDTELDDKVLEETLFYAALFNRDKIVKSLVDKNVSPNWKFGKWSAINFAAQLNYITILETLLRVLNTIELKSILFVLLDAEHFDNVITFEMILSRYCELGGSVNDQDDEGNSLLCFVSEKRRFNITKVKIIQLLLDMDADPTLINDQERNALIKVLTSLQSNNYEFDEKEKDDIFEKMHFAKLTPEKFINVVGKGLFKMDQWTEVELYRHLFAELVTKVGGVNVKDEKGQTLLMSCVQDASCVVDNVDFLVDNGADVNAIDEQGMCVLSHTVKLPKDDIFMNLLEKVSHVDQKVLIEAIKFDKWSIAKKLFEKHFTPDCQFSDGTTPIEIAVRHFSSNIIIICLKEQFKEFHEKQGDVNVRNSKGETLLIKYIQQHKANVDGVKVLVENGVDVIACDINGKCAIDYAFFSHYNYDIFVHLLSQVPPVDETFLLEAIKKNKLPIVKALFPKYFAADHLFSNGKTLIELVIAKPNIFTYVLSEINSIPPQALRLAIEKQQTTVLEKLLEIRFDGNYKFPDGKTLIEVAVQHVSVNLVLLLKEQFKEFHLRRGDTNTRNKKGETLLIKYVQSSKCTLENVEFLVDNGCDVNVQDNKKNNALFYALNLELDHVSLYLLKKVSFVDEEIFVQAVKLKKLSFIKALFEEKLFDINHRMTMPYYKNNTPVEVALISGSKEIQNFLKGIEGK